MSEPLTLTLEEQEWCVEDASILQELVLTYKVRLVKMPQTYTALRRQYLSRVQTLEAEIKKLRGQY